MTSHFHTFKTHERPPRPIAKMKKIAPKTDTAALRRKTLPPPQANAAVFALSDKV
jgi:hypothetical protein